jgi:hypothetical protein
MRLGRKAIKTDSRTLRLARYFLGALPPSPTSKDWTKGLTSFGMMLNDSLGCCTIAGVAHAIQIFSANSGAEVTIPDSDILTAYEQWDGYSPSDPSTDQGGVELDVLTDWKASGFFGHVLDGFADVDPSHTENVQQAINLFGGLYIGLGLPLSAQAQVGGLWDVAAGSDGDPGSWGGHCVFVAAYDVQGLTCITWGALQKMTWAFWNKYVDEAHTLISQDFIAATGLDPSGFDLAALEADIAQIS